MKKQEIKEIGQRIRETRGQLGLTQKEFAHKMYTANTHLSDIENGRVGPGITFFSNIIRYHKVNPLYILFGDLPRFLEEKDGEEAAREKEKEQSAVPDMGRDTPRLQEMVTYFNRSPMVKFAVLNFFSTYIVQHKDLIKDDIALHQHQYAAEPALHGPGPAARGTYLHGPGDFLHNEQHLKSGVQGKPPTGPRKAPREGKVLNPVKDNSRKGAGQKGSTLDKSKALQ